ncbi:MAG: FeoA [Pseudomonadota bacterium]|jgi:ferrous iron transport protein A
MSLSELKIGEKAFVTGVSAKGSIQSRLIALGLTNGTEVKLSRQSAAKQTIIAQVGASVIALRQEEAKTIHVRIHND